MKNNPAILTLFLLVTAFTSAPSVAQSDLSEGWEIKVMNERQPPKVIMDSIGIKAGMVIGEIGAGRGRFTVYMAREVGNQGMIYANDIDENAISYLSQRCRRLGFGNVKTIVGRKDDPMFPEKSLDMAVMIWVYHMIDKPDPLLINLKKSLKPGATLVILDPVDAEVDNEFHIDRKKQGNMPPTMQERIEKSARECGYTVLKIETFLPKDVIYILKPDN